MNKAPLIEASGLVFDYQGHQILNGADLALSAGERVALVGRNGAGKTTLLHLLVGLERPRRGAVCAFGRRLTSEAEFHEIRKRVGLVFQDPDDQLFCPSVIEDVAFGPVNLGHSPPQARALAEATLDTLGLGHLGSRVTQQLSGGEKRLVALATVLAMEPEVLLLDEPTSGLDAASEQKLIDHLDTLPQTMLIVSHDSGVLERLTTRTLALVDGRLTPAVLHRHVRVHQDLHWHAEGLDQDHVHGDPAESDSSSRSQSGAVRHRAT